MLLILLWLLVLLQHNTSGDLVDRESFLARAEARRLIHSLSTAAHDQQTGHLKLDELMFAFSVFPSASLAELIAREWEKGGMNHADQALLWYEKTLALNSTHKHALLTVGIAQHRAGKYLTAMELFGRLVTVDEHDMDGWFHLGLTMQHYGDIQLAAEYYERCLAANDHHVRARINLASLHHQHGLLADAFVHYEILLQQFHTKHTEALAAAPTTHNMVIPAPEYSMVKLNYVVALLQNGYHAKGKDIALSFVRELEVAMSMFDCFGERSDRAMSDERIVLQCTAWQRDIDAAQSHILNIQKSSCDWYHMEERSMGLVYKALGDISRGLTVVYLLPFDSLLIPMTLEQRLILADAYARSIFLPEEGLRLGLGQGPREGPGSEQEHRQRTAEEQGLGARPGFDPSVLSDDLHSTDINGQQRLRLGFISYDFNDHPTAHLVEAIFDVVRRRMGETKGEIAAEAAAAKTTTQPQHLPRRQVFHSSHLIVYSYGHNDNSSYRTRLETLADDFVDLAHVAHAQSSERIRHDRLDVLLEMQVHTLGNRLQTIANQPASVQVNYLVYPGTSGAEFLQYITVDAIVVPPEHARYYSESLLMLPPTYQISFFDRHFESSSSSSSSSSLSSLSSSSSPTGSIGTPHQSSSLRTTLRAQYNLPTHPHAIIFCNFNKIDKLDQPSFGQWMSIMRRVPRSYLWLLKPSKSRGVKDTFDWSRHNDLVMSRLRGAAAAMGVHPSRLLFAERANKTMHILRHAAADLFLDSLVYGAHSTATDALRGGLPVLTIAGDSFPNRVAASLFASFPTQHDNHNHDGGDNMAMRMLVRTSLRDFEDTAVLLTTKKRGLLRTVQTWLTSVVDAREGLFDTEKGVAMFLYGTQGIHEMKSFRSRTTRDKTTNGAYIVKENEGVWKNGQEKERLPHVVVVDPHHRHVTSDI